MNSIHQPGSIIATSREIGAKLPTAVTDAYDRALRITKAAESIYPPQGALIDAVIDALDNDRDPAADPAVARAFLAQRIGSSDGLGRQVVEAVGAQVADAFSLHAATIVLSWAKPFDTAAATISACHERIGDLPLEDAASILRAGGDIASVWAKAQEAVAVIGKISGVWVALAQLTRFAPVDPRFPALRIADATAEQWQASGLDRQKANAWAVQLAGLTLALADGPEYARRVTAVQRDLTPAPEPTPAEVRGREHVRQWGERVNAAKAARVATTL